MDVNEAIRIDRIRSVEGAKGAPAPGSAGGVSEFQKMLEQLRELSESKPQHSSKAGDAEEFTQQMKQADEEFVTVMDLRRRLEDAFQRHQS